MRTFLILLFCFGIATFPAIAQEDILGALRQAAEIHNEAEGEQPEDDAELTEEQRQKREEWKKRWEESKKGMADFLEKSDSKEMNCMALLSTYVYNYLILVEETNNTSLCRAKYDLYGLQLLTLSMGQTMMYCSEDLYNLSNDDRNFYEDKYVLFLVENLSNPEVYDEEGNLNDEEFLEYMDASRAESHYNVYDRLLFQLLFIGTYHETISSYPYDDEHAEDFRRINIGEAIAQLAYFVRPDYYVWRTVFIGKKMEELGCEG